VRRGVRVAAPVAVAVFFVGVSFGVVARPLMGQVAPIVMSMVVFAGSAQFAAVAVLADGGSALAAIAAGILLNARFVPMGIAVASFLPGGKLRALEGQAVVDASFAIANRGGGRFDRDLLLGATLAQYPAWALGTLVGVLAGDELGDPRALGLDAIFPAFFFILLVDELRARKAATAAALAATVALLLTPIAPPGVPVLAAGLVALLGLRAR